MGKHGSTALPSRAPSGIAAIAVAAALWAVAAAVARRLFDSGVDPLELVQARALLSAAGLACVPAAWRGDRGWEGGGGRAGGRTRAGAWTAVALGLSIALVNAAYYLAIDRLAVAVALVLQYTGPAMVVAWIAFTSRSAPSREIVVALAGAFAGVVLVSEVLKGDLGNIDGLGIGFGLASAVLFATYTLLSERAGAAYGVIGALFRGFVAASVMWVLFQIPRGFPSSLVASENLPLVLFVGLAGTLAPFLLYLWGVQRVRAERAVIAATLEPVVAGVVAWIWLDQILGTMQLVGGLLIVAAIASLQLNAAQKMKRKEAVLAHEP